MVKIEDIATRAKSYGIPGVVADGNDIIEMMNVTNEAMERAKNGEGPTLIEAKTYRWKGHSKSDAKKNIVPVMRKMNGERKIRLNASRSL